MAQFPLQEWYQKTGESSCLQQCEVCRFVQQSGVCPLLVQAWAEANSDYELRLNAEAVAYVEAGGDLYTWARQHWIFADSDLLPACEYCTLIQNQLPTRRLVHIGCGALPFTGLYMAKFFDEVVLVDIDPAAIAAAQNLVTAMKLTHVSARLENGKDTPLKADDVVLIASMVLDKTDVFENASKQQVQHILMRSTDERPRSIFYQKVDSQITHYGYHLQQQTQPPLTIDNITLRFSRTMPLK